MIISFAMFRNPLQCNVCGRGSADIASELGVCVSCILDNYENSKKHIEAAHRRSREKYSLLPEVPNSESGLQCGQCTNACKIDEGGIGYCGVRRCLNGRIENVTGTDAIVQAYHDPIPTNCVADWVCAANGHGFPEFSNSEGPEYGFRNLAVFYCGCTFNCLYCQNWHYRLSVALRSPVMSAEELADRVDERTACICYFGGDPTPQIEHALETSRLVLERSQARILRVCWETNGSMAPQLADKAMELSLKSGGCVKFDLKAFSEELHIALTGVSNRRTLDNFKRLGKRIPERRVPPPLIASTLLVPGYVTESEVGKIAGFIADVDPEIPYALLAFHPDFYMHDLPTTSRAQAEAAMDAARSAGLNNVRVGNLHLLR
jgi:pyruvate formate lyase activating enzyme